MDILSNYVKEIRGVRGFYDKPLLVTDAGDNPHTALESVLCQAEKRGIPTPKVSLIAANEKVTNKNPISVVFDRMKTMAPLKSEVIAGPYALDAALSKEKATQKGIFNDVVGESDILIFDDPNTSSVFSGLLELQRRLPAADMQTSLLNSFQDYVEKTNGDAQADKPTFAVAGIKPQTLHALSMVQKYLRVNIVGDQDEIRDIVGRTGGDGLDYTITHVDDATDQSISNRARDLLLSGDANFIIKGNVNTTNLVSALLQLPRNGRSSLLTVSDLSFYPKPVIATDAGINPSFRESVIENAVAFAQTMGVAKPRVALIAASPFSSTMQDTNLLSTFRELAGRPCRDRVVFGPMTIEEALNPTNGYLPDIAIFDDCNAANAFYKTVELMGCPMANFVKNLPALLVSRGDPEDTIVRTIFLYLAYLKRTTADA